MIDGKRVRPGHVLIGLASSGLHSNGYSLARRIIQRRKIPLEDLRYWNIDLQEPYFDAEAALTRWKQLNGKE